MNLRYTEIAEADVDIAMAWYENQRRGLGLEFLDCVEEATARIVEFPTLYSIKYDHFRAAMVRKFPFSVFYTIEKSEIIVHAVFDNRQDPDKKP